MALVTIGPCCKCKCEVSLPEALYEAAKKSSKINFYCAYGHPMIFPEGESEETKLRRERDRLLQEQARLNDEITAERQRAEKAEATTNRLKRRAVAGACPVCKRTFSNMAKHVQHMHPQFTCEATGKPSLKVVA